MPARSASASVTSSRIGFTSADKKFGTHSLLADEYQVDGGGNKSYYPDYATITISPTDSSFYLNSLKTWTIEFFVRRNNANADNQQIRLFCLGTFDSNILNFRIARNAPAQQGGLGVFFYGGGVFTSVSDIDMGTSGSWHHVALVCVGDDKITAYFDGARVVNAQGWSENGTDNSINRKFTVGAKNDQTTHSVADTFYYDEIRISNVARYSGATLTVPTSAFSDDDNTLALLHLDNNYTDSAVVSASATLASTATLTSPSQVNVSPNDEQYAYTWNTVPDDTWDTFTWDRWRVSGVVLSSAATLATTATVVKSASASLASSAQLTATGLRVDFGASALNSTATLSATAGRTVSGTVSLAVTATQTALGAITRGGSSSLSATATLNAVGQRTLAGVSSLSSTASVAVVGRILKFASLFIDSFANLTVSARIAKVGSSQLQVMASLASGSVIAKPGSGQLLATATISATAKTTLVGAASLSTSATLSATGLRVDFGAASLSTSATLSARGSIPRNAAALLSASASLTSGRRLIHGAGSNLSAFAFELSVGKLTRGGRANLASAFTITALGDLQLLDSDFIFRVLPETRNYLIDTETRQQSVLFETTNYIIPSESREFEILPETRTLSSEDFLIG